MKKLSAVVAVVIMAVGFLAGLSSMTKADGALQLCQRKVDGSWINVACVGNGDSYYEVYPGEFDLHCERPNYPIAQKCVIISADK